MPRRAARSISRNLPKSGWRRIALASALITLVTGAAFWAVGTAGASTDVVSLLPDDAVPQIVSDPDRLPVELGMRFSTSEPVEAIAVQIYTGPRNPGPHRATLWSADGEALARVVFRDESAQGLQVAELDRPVSLTKDATYVVSYTAAAGHYSADNYYFTHEINNGPLHADRNAGVYTYRPGSFPRRSYRATNYNVDIVVRPQGSDGEPSAPPSESTSPTPSDTPEPSETVTPTPSESSSPTPSDPGSSEPTDPETSPTDPGTTPTEPETTPPTQPGRFPTRDSAGLPSSWQPTRSITGNYTVSQAGAVVEDLRITNGTITVTAPNVTLRRIDAIGSHVVNRSGNTCGKGLVIEDSDFVQSNAGSGEPVIGIGGYTVRNIVIDGAPEGLRVAEASACGPVVVEDSFIRIVSPDPCGDWHGDGIQGYGGGKLTVRDTTIFFVERNGCGGTAPFFYPGGQGNTGPVDVDGLLLSGGGYPFRLGMAGTVNDLNIVDNSWGYGPIDVNCSLVTSWQAQAVTLSSSGQPTAVRAIPCR